MKDNIIINKEMRDEQLYITINGIDDGVISINDKYEVKMKHGETNDVFNSFIVKNSILSDLGFGGISLGDRKVGSSMLSKFSNREKSLLDDLGDNTIGHSSKR